jgi:hypothetical protein
VHVPEADIKVYPIISPSQERKFKNKLIMEKTMRSVTTAEFLVMTEDGGDYSEMTTDPALAALMQKTQPMTPMIAVFDLLQDYRESVMHMVGMEQFVKLSKVKTLNDIDLASRDMMYLPMVMSNYEMVAIHSVWDLLRHLEIEDSPEMIMKIAEQYPILEGAAEAMQDIIEASASRILKARAREIMKLIKHSEYPQVDALKNKMLITLIPRLDKHTVIIKTDGLLAPLNALSEKQLISNKITSAGNRIILPATIAMVKVTRSIQIKSLTFAFNDFLSNIASTVREENPWINVLESLSLEKLKDVTVGALVKPEVIKSRD